MASTATCRGAAGGLAGIIGGIALVGGGLTFFVEGLRLGVMPLGEALGTTLPQKAPIPVVLLVAHVLGIGVTCRLFHKGHSFYYPPSTSHHT